MTVPHDGEVRLEVWKSDASQTGSLPPNAGHICASSDHFGWVLG